MMSSAFVHHEASKISKQRTQNRGGRREGKDGASGDVGANARVTRPNPFRSASSALNIFHGLSQWTNIFVVSSGSLKVQPGAFGPFGSQASSGGVAETGPISPGLPAVGSGAAGGVGEWQNWHVPGGIGNSGHGIGIPKALALSQADRSHHHQGRAGNRAGHHRDDRRKSKGEDRFGKITLRRIWTWGRPGYNPTGQTRT